MRSGGQQIFATLRDTELLEEEFAVGTAVNIIQNVWMLLVIQIFGVF